MRDESKKLIRERIEYLRHHTDFVATLYESLVGYAIIAADDPEDVLGRGCKDD
jgi:hypothetical protein